MGCAWVNVFGQDAVARDLASAWWCGVERRQDVQVAVKEGKMFGVLIGRYLGEPIAGISDVQDVYPSFAIDHSDPVSRWVYLVACSGQLGGLWNPHGWAPSLIYHQQIAGESWRAQRDLHRLTQRISQAKQRGATNEVGVLKNKRRQRSRQHANLIRKSTHLTPLVGRPRSLNFIWPDAATGVGECCGPKLICWAAQLGIEPIGVAEFQVTYHDATLTSTPRAELITQSYSPRYTLSFYAPCRARCQPLLSFLVNGEVENSS